MCRIQIDSTLINSSCLPDRYFYPIDNYFRSINRKTGDFFLSVMDSSDFDSVKIYCWKKQDAEPTPGKVILGNRSGEDGILYFDLNCNRPIRYMLEQ